MLLEIDFIEEMRTPRHNMEVPQTFLRHSPHSQKYNLIHLTPYHFQLAFRDFVTSQKAYFCKNSCRLPNAITICLQEIAYMTKS